MAVLLVGLAPQDPAALIEQLRSDDIAVRERAFVELEKLGAAAEEALKKVVDDKDVAVASTAHRLLRIIKVDRALSPAMKKAMPGIARRVGVDESHWIRDFLSVLEARAEPGKDRPYPDLRRPDLEPLAVAAVDGARTREDKLALCKAVGKFHFSKAEPGLIRFLREPDLDLALQAAHALQEFHGTEVVALLVRETSHLPEFLPKILDEEEDELLSAAQAAILPLTKLLGHPNRDTRRRARDVLIKMRARECVPAAKDLQQHRNMEVREDAMFVLMNLAPEVAAAQTLELLGHSDSATRSAAAYWAGFMDIDVPAPLRTRLLKDANPNVQLTMLILIADRFTREALDDVLGLLKHPESRVRCQVIRTIKAIGNSTCVDRLSDLMADDEDGVRREALNVAVALDPKRAFELALGRLDDDDGEVQAEALLVLSRFRSRVPVDRLLRILKDEKREKGSPGLVQAAAVLASLDPARARPFLEALTAGRTDDPYHLISVLASSPDPVPLLISALEADGDTSDRAAECLAKMDPGPVVPALRKIVTEPEAPGRRWAARLLGIHRIEDARADLLKLLKDEDCETRAAALMSLCDLGKGAGIERIRAMTRDEDERVRRRAARALGIWGDRASVPDLRLLLNDVDENVAWDAGGALWDLRDPNLGPMALEMLRSGNRNRLGSRLLFGWPGKQETGRIVPLLQDRDPWVRNGAVTALGMLRARSLAREVIPLLRERATQENAAEALGAMEASEVVPDLVRLMEAPDAVSRVGALRALEALGGSEAAKAIRSSIERPDAGLRVRGVEALGLIGDKDSIPRLRSLLRDSNRILREAAIRSLSALEAREASRDLVALLDDPEESVQEAACQAIADLGLRELIPELVKRLRGRESQRSDVIRLLGQMEAKEAIPALIDEIKNGDSYYALPALVRMKAPEVLPYLRKKIADRGFAEFLPEFKARPWDFDWTCIEAAQAVAEVGDTSYLRTLVKSPRPDVRISAAEWLCRLGDAEGVPVILSQPEPYGGTGYHNLNRLRRPDAWKRLDALRAYLKPRESRRHLVHRLGRIAGLDVRWPEPATLRELEFESGALGWQGWSYPLSLLDQSFRLQFAHGGPRFGTHAAPPFDYVLEDDHIRILTWREATEFWKRWWADEQARKK